MAAVTKKIMIVVWKWDFLPDHLNANLIRKKYNDKLPNLNAGKGQFYDEYVVEPSLLCPAAELVAVKIYNDGELAVRLLEKLIESYLPTGKETKDQVMLFLHRNNDFDENDVTHFLNKYSDRLYKAFLFAQGRDYIYSNAEKQRIGLLNHMGEFDYGLHVPTGEKYFVSDDEKKVVFQPYFDRVWSYYDIEFEIKVFDLKEDLFDCLFPLFLPGASVTVPVPEVLELLKREDGGLLWFRLKSFMDVYDQNIKSTENLDSFVEEGLEMTFLREAEKKSGKSYFFDDCIANLERERQNDRHFLSQEYDEVKSFMQSLFLDKNRKRISIEELRDLAARLNYLVKIIPGMMD